MQLDRIDFEILDHLQNNARLSNKELAALVDLAPSSCLERVRRLTRDGALEGFHARVSDEALGIGVQAMIEVSLEKHSRETVQVFTEYALNDVDEVIGLFHVTGDQDFFMHVAVRDADHLRDLLLDRFTTRPEVSRLQTHIVFRHHRRPVRPALSRPLAHSDQPG
ncbi:MAG: Lrp/AsnC family transcriptional regulator [Gemmatimonadetes bacterium]|nr:Lrp/AsnC family transcriptional regulator [Gemmatimonadota bacterium]